MRVFLLTTKVYALDPRFCLSWIFVLNSGHEERKDRTPAERAHPTAEAAEPRAERRFLFDPAAETYVFAIRA